MSGVAGRRLNELGKRVTTGVVGGTLLLLLLVAGGRIGASFLAFIISFGMLYEYVEITVSLEDKQEKRWVLLGAAWLVAFANFWIPRAEYALLLISFLGLFSYFLFTAERHGNDLFRQHFREFLICSVGMLYLGFLPLFLPLIRDSVHGAHWAVVFLLVVWAGDTGAYFAGKKYGRKKLYPLISPKKTVEGALGGLLAGFGVALIYKGVFFSALSWGGLVVISIMVGSVAQVGDLCESFLKRAFDRKDSGSILPGHGGFLDRFDGVVFSLPVMYGCVRIFG